LSNKETMNSLINDVRILTVEQLQSRPHAKIMSLTEIIPLLASPDSGALLQIGDDQSSLTDSLHNYPVANGAPVLYPASITKAFLGEGLQLTYYNDSKLQYFLLSQIKQRGEINAASSNVHYQRHLFRMEHFLRECRGTVLDVGCDDVNISAALFNENCNYIGLDPFSSAKSNFRVIGVGEFLPFRDESVDNVVFNTSLDHILDYQLALDEARRVLKPNGHLYISTLIWTANASLLNDLVHFHHFRDYEIMGGLNGMHIEAAERYQYKEDEHRHGLFVHARKSFL
jgi:SAM-dependent methyltransferase